MLERDNLFSRDTVTMSLSDTGIFDSRPARTRLEDLMLPAVFSLS